VLADESLRVKDVEVSVLINAIELNKTYSELVLIKNNDDIIGFDDNLTVNVTWSVANNSFNKVKKLNYYTKSGFGFLKINNSGNYSFCASYSPIDFFDPNPLNNKDCVELIVGKEEKLDECLHMNIWTDEFLYSIGQSIKFKIETDDSYIYWVEDLFGNYVKNKVNSSSKSEKSFTPNFNEQEKVFVIKAKNECNNTAEKIVVFRGENVTKKNTSISLSIPENVEYSKNFYVDIKGYKGNSQKTLISIWLEKDEKKVSEITKTYIEDQETDFKQKLPINFKKLDYEKGDYYLVLDGLGITIREKTNIVGEEKSLDKSSTKDEKNIEQKSENTPEITGFYTRKQKFEEKINVYVNINKYSDEDILEVNSLLETISINKLNKSNSINIKISKPNEKLYAILKSDEQIYDIKELKLNLENQKQKEETIIESTKEFDISNDTIENNTIDDVKEEYFDFENKANEEKKDYSRYLYFLGFGTLFFALFKKEILKTKLKKTKLFKWVESFKYNGKV